MECSVCFEKNSKTRFFVECEKCGDYSVCVECAAIYITTPNENNEDIKGCMVCKKKWDNSFIKYIFPYNIYMKYIALEKDTLFEREKKLMKYTQPLVEHAILVDKLTKENEKLRELYNTLKAATDEVMENIYMNEDKIYNAPIPEGKYVMTCPGEECKGFIKDSDWTCGICNTSVCKKCLSKIDHISGEISSHKCKNKDIRTAKLILSNTKACPSCATRIIKLEGCSQMFCTNCYTAFDWETLAIVKGNIHNPHYYELMAQGKIVGNNRTLGDVPCGGIPPIYSTGVFIYMRTSILRKSKAYLNFLVMNRRASEIEEYYRSNTFLRPLEELFTDVRVEYMLNKLTEEEYKDKLFRIQKYINKCRKEYEILGTFLAIVSERLGYLCEESNKIPMKKNNKKIDLRQKRKIYLDIFNPIEQELETIFDLINCELLNNKIGTLSYKDEKLVYYGQRREEIIKYQAIRMNRDYTRNLLDEDYIFDWDD